MIKDSSLIENYLNKYSFLLDQCLSIPEKNQELNLIQKFQIFLESYFHFRISNQHNHFKLNVSCFDKHFLEIVILKKLKNC